MIKSTTPIAAELPMHNCHLWNHVSHNTQPTVQGKDAHAEYLALIKTALQKTIQNINFADPIQTNSAHKVLIQEVNEEARCSGTRYNVKMKCM